MGVEETVWKQRERVVMSRADWGIWEALVVLSSYLLGSAVALSCFPAQQTTGESGSTAHFQARDSSQSCCRGGVCCLNLTLEAFIRDVIRVLSGCSESTHGKV